MVSNVKVACQCGWEGSQNDLIGMSGKLYCPACETPFKPWPSRQEVLARVFDPEASLEDAQKAERE